MTATEGDKMIAPEMKEPKIELEGQLYIDSTYRVFIEDQWLGGSVRYLPFDGKRVRLTIEVIK
jgi:hypothetical protein